MEVGKSRRLFVVHNEAGDLSREDGSNVRLRQETVRTSASGPRRGRMAARPTGRGSTASRRNVVRRSRASSSTVISEMAKAAPRQRCEPPPNGRNSCGPGRVNPVRDGSHRPGWNRNGSGHSAGSRAYPPRRLRKLRRLPSPGGRPPRIRPHPHRARSRRPSTTPPHPRASRTSPTPSPRWWSRSPPRSG